ncbi:hypothetical protein M1B72_03380 [Geomonas paludis]|uniref:Oxidoreductase n=1 Tax=Geomonas paludis TaxID=2740185 RepID=A0A6V8N0N8_9BACT|nr:Gfo/Idh/MocA family oxidoreductase [Geomonas paludis]UPU36766.1 hypothetical protein M1B72_03380 [Geomonas paludis]GFO66058.1 hypothetical protein GMPD_39770 [Geomonas paludis]
MKALVVGYGSIGSRHARILAELGCEVALVTSRPTTDYPRFSTIPESISGFQPDYVVLASETAKHHAGLCELAEAGFAGRVLVEKPLFHEPRQMPQHRFQSVYVAYNLRFHPLLQKLRHLLEVETVVSVQAYVGQYLPGWRPGRDYRDGYSANGGAGGGVLRDLSHELDYLNWLLGGWRQLTALGGHYSALEISSDDVFAVMLTTVRCPVVTVQLNYLDRLTRRELVINTQQHTIGINFITGELVVDDVRQHVTAERDHTYREMHRAVVEGQADFLCTLEEGIDVVGMVAAAERAVTERRWVWK